MSTATRKPAKSTRSKPAAGAPRIEHAAEAGTSVATAGAATAEGIEQAIAATCRSFEATTGAGQRAIEDLDDLFVFGRENLKAMVRSGTVLGQGAQKVGRFWLASTQKTLRDGAGRIQEVLKAKTFQEAVRAQSQLAKAGVDAWAEESAALAAMTAKVFEEASAPIAQRLKATVKTLRAPRQP
ncbi:MAG: phasin family protein [Proteobacteria bacterium]|nr:phasin family protein [Pseudomonadota bacterium]